MLQETVGVVVPVPGEVGAGHEEAAPEGFFKLARGGCQARLIGQQRGEDIQFKPLQTGTRASAGPMSSNT